MVMLLIVNRLYKNTLSGWPAKAVWEVKMVPVVCRVVVVLRVALPLEQRIRNSRLEIV